MPATAETAIEIVAPAANAAPNRLLVFLSFFSTYIIWGSTYLAIRYAVATIPPLYCAGFRHLAAGTTLLLICVAKRLRPTAAQVSASVVIGFFFFLVGHGSLHWAEQRVPSGLASLFVAIEPILVFILSSAVSRRWRLNLPLVAGVLLGFAGVAVLVGRTALSSAPGLLFASVMILVGALSWSAGIVYSRNSKLSGHPLLLSAMSLLAGSVMLITAATIKGEWKGFSFSSVTQRSWFALAYLIVFGSIITFTAYNWLLEHYSPTLVATHTYINPIVAVLLGWLFAGEAVTITVVLAAAMVVGAVILVDRGTSQLDRPQNLLA